MTKHNTYMMKSFWFRRWQDYMEAKRKKKYKEKWNENVETCSDCGIQWKKIGKSCPVCYAPSEKKKKES